MPITGRTIIVRATRDHTVGPYRQVAVSEDAIRQVQVSEYGAFATTTDEGVFFGMCKLGEGWEEVKREGQEPTYFAPPPGKPCACKQVNLLPGAVAANVYGPGPAFKKVSEHTATKCSGFDWGIEARELARKLAEEQRKVEDLERWKAEANPVVDGLRVERKKLQNTNEALTYANADLQKRLAGAESSNRALVATNAHLHQEVERVAAYNKSLLRDPQVGDRALLEKAARRREQEAEQRVLAAEAAVSVLRQDLADEKLANEGLVDVANKSLALNTRILQKNKRLRAAIEQAVAIVDALDEEG